VPLGDASALACRAGPLLAARGSRSCGRPRGDRGKVGGRASGAEEPASAEPAWRKLAQACRAMSGEAGSTREGSRSKRFKEAPQPPLWTCALEGSCR